MDANPNPLRTRVLDRVARIFDGRPATGSPGIGAESPIDDPPEFVTMHESFTMP